MSEQQVVFVAQGKLHRRTGSGEIRVVESVFGRSLRDRAAEITNRHAWKSQGRGAQFLYGMSPGRGGRDGGELAVRISSACPGPEPGSLFYSLHTDEVGGVFAVDAQGAETRLFHTADFRIGFLALSPRRDEIAASVAHSDFTSNIAVMKTARAGFDEVTEGESLDLAPSWVPSSRRELVFQSAGIGRNSAGVYSGLGPSAIQKIDLDSGELTVAAEENGYDLMAPRADAAGSLWFIRRPYRVAGRALHPMGALADALLLPFRMAHALFQFFNFFSIRYTGKPLETSGGAAARQPDLKQMMIWGNLIDATQAARSGARLEGDAPDMVPSSWQLMRRDADGGTHVVARSVLAFDTTADGAVLYSNGNAIYRVAAGATRPERVLKAPFIEQLAAA